MCIKIVIITLGRGMWATALEFKPGCISDPSTRFDRGGRAVTYRIFQSVIIFIQCFMRVSRTRAGVNCINRLVEELVEPVRGGIFNAPKQNYTKCNQKKSLIIMTTFACKGHYKK